MKEGKLSTVPGGVRHETFECRVDNYGRITIPKAVRERMHWEAGDRIKFTIRPMGTNIVNSGVPDQYYLVLKPLRGKIPADINLEF
jgi:AbrB family looped-hinge helix DNA binding protein